MTPEENKSRIVFITGLSGAGMSTAMKAFEDMGYETVSNLPVSLLDAFLKATGENPVAIGIDSRTAGFTPRDFLTRVRDARTRPVSLVFLTADYAVLQNRFSETRRRHPMGQNGGLMEGLRAEEALMGPLQAEADLTIDTTQMNTHDLRRYLNGHFRLNDDSLLISVISFSYAHGLPRDADNVFDVRFLRNPHYEPHLREKTGQDPGVAHYIAQDPVYPWFADHLKKMFDGLLPRYREAQKSYLTLAFGCTGGKHRSVHIAEMMADHIEAGGTSVHRVHRELKL